MNINTSETGRLGEELACRFLSEKGFRILERNFRFHKGEIDIIAKDEETLVFVEVKYRQNLEYGYPEEAITRNKILQIRRVANAYIFERKIENVTCRFDVIAILEVSRGRPIINHYLNAF
ncbi:MAG: YraN family protein [Bacteroidota bacterium]|nr:YraN family protein [Bacteroidota bacterium]MDP4189995.1 YraN family protein [Bacteroidota bacterium]MDP4193427.1 YraN family protein [Bacteroidota bacterium]